MATEVFSGAPQGVDTSRPHVAPRYGNQGVAAQRQGVMTNKHKPATCQWAATSGTQPDPVNLGTEVV